MNPEHPLLIKLLGVLPVLLLDKVPVVVETDGYYVSSWFDSDQYRFGYYVLFRNVIDPYKVVFHARLIPVAIGVLGAVLAFWWGKRLGRSNMAGAMSGLLLLLYPEYLGHSRFLTFDVPTLVACGGVSVAAYLWWRRPGVGNAVLFGAVAAIGSMVKLPVSVFVVFQLLVLAGLCVASRRRIRISKWLIIAGVAFFFCYFSAWASAGFRFQCTNPAMGADKGSHYVPADGNYGVGLSGAVLSWLWQYKLLPETSLAVLYHASSFQMRNYFLMGDWRYVGWYKYFFVTFVLKTSLIMLLVYLASGAAWIQHMRSRPRLGCKFELGRLALFLLPYVGQFCVFVLGRASLGHRYILFVYFPLSVLSGVAMARWWIAGRRGKLVTGAVLSISVLTFALQYPNYETYFNEVVRTPYRAMKYVADSNIDWGQDFPAVRTELKNLGVSEVNLAMFGASRPGMYGISNYQFILPNYPFAVFNTAEYQRPLASQYTVMSLSGLSAARSRYPGKYERDPDWIYNSVVIFKPDTAETY